MRVPNPGCSIWLNTPKGIVVKFRVSCRFRGEDYWMFEHYKFSTDIVIFSFW